MISIKKFNLLFILLTLFCWTPHLSAENIVDIKILKFKFIPQTITIEAGTTVRWRNEEKRQYHSVWFEQSGEPEPDYFFPGETYQRTFDQVGSYPYRCGPHPKMVGTIHVKKPISPKKQ